MSSKSVNSWLMLWKTTRAVELYAQRSIEKLGLGVTDFAVLEALLHKGPLLISELGKLVLLTSGSMTAAVDRLEKQDFVERKNDPCDRRARIVSLTSKGEKLISKAFAQHADDIELLMAALSKEELRQLQLILSKLRSAGNELLSS